ncbi:glutamate/tyrosine decarboxylase-like PLP-dependent enzyme [Nocardioides ginsengisegetis]|uniref:Glutamate/tyrosine decarboxylase-like PLP-dependent enzyme n=1 Tax=Nocardioides ginsengisegetis TaxID=661491 RepID=A0A7W3P9R8_9ACTN|nr:glutamate/tyrosine decarboxylase-like PLP-dependent enzyme [Nocardioides ginsengisegetis]
MQDAPDIFARVAQHAALFRAGLRERRVAPDGDAARLAKAFGDPLPDAGSNPVAVVDALVRAAEPGLVATAGPRFFGFVIGGSLPAATAADMLTSAWDQCAFNAVLSPAAIAAERAAGSWLKDLLGIPAWSSVGFVTGAQEANTVGLAAARHHVLAVAGWDVARRGLLGGPAVRVVASAERHATIDRSLRLLGLGDDCVEEVATDANGAMDMVDLARVMGARDDGPTILCLQAGNVNTGACDDLVAGCDVARQYDAWVHVDGAFGLWAAASPTTSHLVRGLERADSWGCDGHKWLNLPYDSGFAFCAHPQVHAAAVSYTASYLSGSGEVEPGGADLTLSSSRRARGFAAWAGLRELGRDGVAELVERPCALARRFADSLSARGVEVVNDVVLNQVLVSFGSDATTDAVIAGVQREGTCWMGGTTWRGRRLMRISVSNWSTTQEDVDASVDAIMRVRARLRSS